MTTCTKETVPSYLRNSILYNYLDNTDEFDVPANCCVNIRDAVIEVRMELSAVLASLRFWVTNAVPTELIELSTQLKAEDRCFFQDVCRVFELDLPFLQCLVSLSVAMPNDVLDTALFYGELGIVSYMWSTGLKWSRNSCFVAARLSTADCLHFAHEHGAKWDATTAISAIHTGSLSCLHYALSHGCPHDPFVLCVESVANGQLECLQYLHQQRGVAMTDAVAREAVFAQDLSVLKYVLDHLVSDGSDCGDGDVKEGLCRLAEDCSWRQGLRYLRQVRQMQETNPAAEANTTHIPWHDRDVVLQG